MIGKRRLAAWVNGMFSSANHIPKMDTGEQANLGWHCLDVSTQMPAHDNALILQGVEHSGLVL